MVEYYSSRFDDNDALFDNSLFDADSLIASESVVNSDSIVKDASKVVDESVMFSDGDAKHVFRSLFESVSLNDGVEKKAKKFLLEDFGLTDSIVNKVFKNLSETVSVNDLVNKIAFKVLSEDVSLLDDVSVKAVVDISLSDDFSVKTKSLARLMREDLSVIYTDFPWASVVNWTRYVRTEDEMGRSSLDTQVFSKSVNLIVQPLSEKDRSVLGVGESVSGLMKAYAKKEYQINNEFIGFNVGDFVEYKGKDFIVEKVEGRFGGFTEVFSKLILRSVDND